MELTLPAAKRIKLEHSYAVTTGTIRIECPEVEEEDPLKICPEDFAIKVENEEDIVIKQEEVGDVDANQSVEYFNLPNISQQLENHSHAHSTTLLPDEENDSVNNETDCLELEDNCDITVKMDPFILENDMVPKQVFLEFQQNYEKTIRDLKSQNERILSVAERVTKENGEVLQGTLVNSPPFDQQTLQTHAELVNEITRLKDELRESKSKEALLETKVNIRGEALKGEVGNGETSRTDQLEHMNCSMEKQQEASEATVQELKDQLAKKEAENLDYESRCSALTQKVIDLEVEISKKEQKLTKVREKIREVQKSVGDLNELREEWRVVEQREAQRERELRENIASMISLVQDLRNCKSVLKQKIEECDSTRAEMEKLTVLFLRKEEEEKRENEAKKKQTCKYCGCE